MSDDNVIPFARNRGFDRPPQRSHSEDPNELLRLLRGTKRLLKADQATLVENLGHLIIQFDTKNAKAIALDVLKESEREKRKRYIRFPDDKLSQKSRPAASGGSFAQIIERLVELHVRKNISREAAMSEVVRKALRKTSFRPSLPFLMPGKSNAADVALFAADMKTMSDRLADETELAEFLALLAKHPIFPDEAWYQWTYELELKADHEPNHIYEWGSDSDEYEINEWIPWWAPRCLIGHWYVPFSCPAVRVPQVLVPEILAQQNDQRQRHRLDNYTFIEPFIDEKHLKVLELFHRLPVWLIVLPLPDRLVPCLYAATHHPGGYYPDQKYPLTDSSLHPFFVSKIGTDIRDDAVLLPDADNDDLNTCYASANEAEIIATGSRIDESVRNFNCEFQFASTPEELPEWLEERPVQRFLKLTHDSEAAMSFALASRLFAARKGETGDGTVFRPAFSDVSTPYTGLRHDSIAAYLLRNLVSDDGSSIFGSLKKDIAAKRDAAQLVLHKNIEEYRKRFEQRYEK